MDTKTCGKCHRKLPRTTDYFHKNSHTQDGFRYQCKTCQSGASKRYQTRWLNQNREATTTYNRNCRLHRCGITFTQQDFDALLAKQDERCAICGRPFVKTPHVDHCHKTKIVRGLLCVRCNFLLGYAHDDPEILTKAIQYLKKGRHTPESMSSFPFDNATFTPVI